MNSERSMPIAKRQPSAARPPSEELETIRRALPGYFQSPEIQAFSKIVIGEMGHLMEGMNCLQKADLIFRAYTLVMLAVRAGVDSMSESEGMALLLEKHAEWASGRR